MCSAELRHGLEGKSEAKLVEKVGHLLHGWWFDPRPLLPTCVLEYDTALQTASDECV